MSAEVQTTEKNNTTNSCHFPSWWLWKYGAVTVESPPLSRTASQAGPTVSAALQLMKLIDPWLRFSVQQLAHTCMGPWEIPYELRLARFERAFYVQSRSSWTKVCKSDRQDKQCTYNLTLRRVRTTIVAAEKQWILHNLSVYIYSFRYPACNAHAPCCRMWRTPLHKIFPHYLINGTIFGKKVSEHKIYVSSFSTNLSGTFFIVRRTDRNTIENVYWSSCKLPVILFGLQWNLNFRDWVAKNPQISKFMKVLPVAAELFHAGGQTDTHDETNRCFSQFCEAA